MYGLPASGKTTLANSFNDSICWNNNILSIDSIPHGKDNITGRLRDEVKRLINHGNGNMVIIDGLLTINSDLIMLLNILSEFKKNIKSIEIYAFKENREQCLLNDKNRKGRLKKSDITIKNLPYEIIDLTVINPDKLWDIKIFTKDVVVKPNWKIFADEYDLNYTDKGYVKSEEWYLGGTWGSCWGDSGTVSPEAPITEFKEFDELLGFVCPNISFLTYKSIYNKCVTAETSEHGDYYGGCVTYSYFEFNVEKLYDCLVEKGILTYKGQIIDKNFIE